MLSNPMSEERASSFAAAKPTSAVYSRSTKLPRLLVACLPCPHSRNTREHAGRRATREPGSPEASFQNSHIFSYEYWLKSWWHTKESDWQIPKVQLLFPLLCVGCVCVKGWKGAGWKYTIVSKILKYFSRFVFIIFHYMYMYGRYVHARASAHRI